VDRVLQQWTRDACCEVANPAVGPIRLTRRGIKDAIAHGLAREKAAAFAAVPVILATGIVLTRTENWKGRGVDTCAIGGPLIIADMHYAAVAIIRRSGNDSTYYLHEVILRDSLRNAAFKTGASATKDEPSGAARGAIRILLQRIYADNAFDEQAPRDQL